MGLERRRPRSSSARDANRKGKRLLAYIHANLLNSSIVLKGPFGDRQVVYCDFTASGLSLKFFEEFILNEVLPDYANVHSFLSGNARQTTSFRNDSKLIIKQSVNAKDTDALLFVGNGTTGAIHKLIHNINLSEPPIVFVGPFEHHSNLLPWRHLAAKVIRLKTTIDGEVSMDYLEEALKAESKIAKKTGCKMMVCLSAASNVTGILVDTEIVSSLVHQYGGIIFWDYATAAPYIEIDMNPPKRNGLNNSYKDAVFFSVHKFVGGPQTPGILVAKKKLFVGGENYPSQSGGGTVNFVRRKNTSYIKDVEGREEGGTPAIVESIRAGMVIQLKEAIGVELICKREAELVELAWLKFAECPNLVVLGGSKAKRLAIFSFVIRHTSNHAKNHLNSTSSSSSSSNDGASVKSCGGYQHSLFIHHDLVCALLNDLFGIQSRSGCACAGPYALDLLGINENLARNYEEALITKENDEVIEHKCLRPGFTRINLPFFYPNEEIKFILDAVVFVATYGWMFMPFYELDQESGLWRYSRDKRKGNNKMLTNITYEHGMMRWRKPNQLSAGDVPNSLEDCMKSAKMIQKSLLSVAKQSSFKPCNEKMDRYWMKSDMNYLRFFILSSEAIADIRGVPRPKSMYPNKGSPWHPGCIERCFCPELARQNRDSLVRLCEYGVITDDSSDGHTMLMSSDNTSSEYRSSTDIVYTGPRKHRNFEKENWGKHNELNHNRSQMENIYEYKPVSRGSRSMVQRMSSISQSSLSHSSTGSDFGWPKTPMKLLKPTSQAIRLFSMIQPGDRVLVSLSGGQSSMALLHCLHGYQNQLLKESDGIDGIFEMAAVIVDLSPEGFNLLPLVRYLQKLGVKHHYEKRDIADYCSHAIDLCTSVKQEVIHNVARTQNYNVLALAQNLDDMAASFLSSVFHNGVIQTMEVNIELKDLNLRLIRPLVFCREKEITVFIKSAKLPILKTTCAICEQSKMKEARLKELLATEEDGSNPHIFGSISHAISPLLYLSNNVKEPSDATIPPINKA